MTLPPTQTDLREANTIMARRVHSLEERTVILLRERDKARNDAQVYKGAMEAAGAEVVRLRTALTEAAASLDDAGRMFTHCERVNSARFSHERAADARAALGAETAAPQDRREQ